MTRSMLPIRALTLALIGTFVFAAGCDSNEVTDEPEPEIANVAISPDSVSIEVGEQVDFSLVALTADGDTIQNADLDVEWWSSDSEVFTVESGGRATGRNVGTAFCMIEVSDEAASAASHLKAAKFVGRDSAFVMVF